ncbi:MAG TPA: alpha/beta hydrolase [Hyphomonadaceae bacterium]|jgi:pimeloyl-ACP methyl ester carboxylesterase|nr:alpha/beta hydrolase [Hyphomonadaceae bacterium]
MRTLEIPVTGVDADITLSARTAGDKSKPGLILLHGWPHSSRVYDDVIPDLAEDNFVLAFDLPGIGDSHGVPASGEKTLLADIILTAAESAGAKDIIMAGFDCGGMISFSAARDHGQRIRGALVMNTVIPGLDPWEKVLADPRIFHFALHNVPQLPELLVTGHEREYFDFFHNILSGNPAKITDGMRDEFARAYSRPEALKAGFDWYRAFAADAKHNARHKKITTPIRYMRGDADIAGNKLEQYEAGFRKVGVENLKTGILRNSGEYVSVEAPQELIKAIRDLRAEVSAKAEA